MRSRLSFSRASLLALALLTAPPGVKSADGASANELLPDKPYQRKAPRTYLFSRAQFKYTLTADDHLNRYVDRPLLLAPEHGDPQRHFEHAAKLALQYGLDGLAFFPTNGFAEETYSFTQKQPEAFRLLTEFYPSKDPLAAIGRALHVPQSMRLDGKLLLSTYNSSTSKLLVWNEKVQKIRKTFPEETLVIPDINNFAGIPLSSWITKYTEQSLTEAEIEQAREHVRYWLRTSDGAYYSAGEILRRDDRTFNREFYEDFLIRLFKSVLSEEEFKGKYLGLVGKLGHENHTRMGYTLNSNGTKTLRDSMDAALAATPDFINLPEWDELNESTCLMPTVFDGYSTMRLMRYYSAKARSTAPTPLPQDDLKQPNTILSYRKIVALGERLEFELLNVPDSTDDAPYTATFILRDVEGNVLYRSEPLPFNRRKLQEHRVTFPSEQFSQHHLLRPALEIVENGETTQFDEGLHSLLLRATWNWDYKWVKQPIRDILKVKETAFTLASSTRPGLLKATASIQTDEPLAVFELLENDNPIYIHAAQEGDRWRDRAEQAVLSISWKSEQSFGKPALLNGSITLEGATGEWTRMTHPGVNGVDAKAIAGQTFRLDGQRSNIWQRRVLLSIPTDEIPTARLKVTLSGNPTEEIPVAELLAKGAYAIAAPESVNMVISRFTRQMHFPAHLQAKKAAFEVDVWPEAPDAVYQVRAIGLSGRIYRSAPITLLPSGGKEGEVAFFSDSTRQPARAPLPAARIPDIRYDFTPRHGALLTTSAGRQFWGVIGGFTTLITERGASPGDGSIFLGDAFASHAYDGEASAPRWVALESGRHALEFNGTASYVNLPQGVIPRRGGYTIEMEVNPEKKGGMQPLLANYSSRFGTLALYLMDGELQADFLHDLQNLNLRSEKGIATGVKVPHGEWTTIKVRYDQAQLTLSAGGKEFTHPLRGPGAHDVVSALGYYQKEWYKGQIRALRILHSPEEPQAK